MSQEYVNDNNLITKIDKRYLDIKNIEIINIQKGENFMHELAITKQLIESVVSECKLKRIRFPKKIVTELGTFTSYEKDPEATGRGPAQLHYGYSVPQINALA